MKEIIFSMLAAATLTLGVAPSTAEACGGYSARIDPVEQQIQLVVNEHFTKVRTAVRVQAVTAVRYDSSAATATVLFVDRRDRQLAQDVRLTMRGTHWAVVGGSSVRVRA